MRSSSSTVAGGTETAEAEANGLCVQLRPEILYYVKVLFKNEVRFLFFLENKNGGALGTRKPPPKGAFHTKGKGLGWTGCEGVRSHETCVWSVNPS